MREDTNMRDPRDGDRTGREGCAEARERIHAVLDGDLMDAEERLALDRHLTACAACSEARRELEQIQKSLRSMSDTPLPEDAFDDVLARTSRANVASRLRRFGTGWRAAAAAALLAAALWSAWPTGPDQAEIDQATAEARMVILLTAQALSRTQRVAIREGIAGEVSPALRSVRMKMPSTPHDKDL